MGSCPTFPEEILFDILSRLPVKSVGQCRCVSKSWRALLSQPQFIRAHLHRSQSPQQSQSLLLLIYDRSCLFSASLSNNAHNLLEDEIIVSCTKLNFAHVPDSWSEIQGACDGLLLVSHDNGNKKFVLNPITREIRDVSPFPLTTNLGGSSPFFVSGLGYDSVSNDYKIVIVSTNYHGEASSGGIVAYVYSLKTGSWARVESCPQNYTLRGSGFFVCGCLNWLGLEWNEDCTTRAILSFNLVDEKFMEIPLPKLDQQVKIGYCDVLDGCLCIYCWNATTKDRAFWVMREYGVQESWVKFTINVSKCMPRHCLNQEQVLMLKDWRYVMYNLKQGTLKEVTIDGISNIRNCVKSFPESLISPHGSW